MTTPSKPVCLIVAGNVKTAAELRRIVKPYQQPWTVRTIEEAFDSLGCQPATVIAENIEHSAEMIEFLKTVRVRCPQARRLLVTEACNLTLVVSALHSGVVDHLVYQPLDEREIVPLLIQSSSAFAEAVGQTA